MTFIHIISWGLARDSIVGVVVVAVTTPTCDPAPPSASGTTGDSDGRKLVPRKHSDYE